MGHMSAGREPFVAVACMELILDLRTNSADKVL